MNRKISVLDGVSSLSVVLSQLEFQLIVRLTLASENFTKSESSIQNRIVVYAISHTHIHTPL